MIKLIPEALPPSATSPNPPRPTSQVTRIVVFGLVALLTIGALIMGINWARYRYQHLVLKEASVHGTVTKVGARIEGRVRSIEVEAGQRVAKGDVLLRMEDQHLQAALDRARAELLAAIKQLEVEKLGIEQTRRQLSLEIERVNGVRNKVLGELEAEKSNLARLEKEHERVSTLVKSGTTASSELDRITGDRDRSNGLVSAARGALEAAESTHQSSLSELEGLRVREARLALLESQITVARANVSVAEADLDATVLRAPEAGQVLERIVESGGSAKVGEPMISLWIGSAWIEAWADERDLQEIKKGSRVDISLDAAPGKTLSGRVEAIGLVTDKHLQPTAVPSTLHALVRQNAMVPIRIALEENHVPLQLGLSALVGISRTQIGSTETDGAPAPRRLLTENSKTTSAK